MGLELGGELPVVVDLAVERDPDTAVLVRERLLSGRHIDDAQAGVAEPDTGCAALAGAVRTAMRDRRPHPQEAVQFDGLGRIDVGQAADAAHQPGRRCREQGIAMG